MRPLLPRRLTTTYDMPVDLQALKLALKVDNTEEDEYISDLAKAAAQLWEDRVRQPVMQADYVVVSSNGMPELWLPVATAAISRIDYLALDGTVAELPAANYVSSVLWPDKVVFASTALAPFPSVSRSTEALRVYYTAGAATPEEVPPLVRQFIYRMVAHWYENRQDVIAGVQMAEVPLGAQALIDLEREPVL